MQTNAKDIMDMTIKEAFPELYQAVQNSRKAVEKLNEILEPYRVFANSFLDSQKIMNFAESLKNQIIVFCAEEQYWAISDITLIKHLQSVSENKYSETITNYYEQDNYAKIDELSKTWEGLDCIAKRLPIIKSCLNIMQNNSNNIDVATVVIPTLTAQITGIAEDLCGLVPEDDYKEISNDLRNGQKNPTKGEITTEYLWRLDPKKELFFCSNVIFNAVMKNTNNKDNFTEEELEKYNKYRNKILHGDIQFLNYGTNENLVRTWLELNILIRIYAIYKDYELKESINE